MTQPLAIKACFSEWRMVKSRKVLQLIFEVPLERQGKVFEILGAPMPDQELWCGIARLAGSPEEMLQIEKPKSLAQEAGIYCSQKKFQSFLSDIGYLINFDAPELAAKSAAIAVRENCGVKSRSEFDNDQKARRSWINLRGKYKAWEHPL